MPFAPLRQSWRASTEGPAAPANNHSALNPTRPMANGSKQPPLMVVCAHQTFTALAPNQLSVRRGDFFHVLTPPTTPGWLPICNPLSGAHGLAPARLFDVLMRSADCPAPIAAAAAMSPMRSDPQQQQQQQQQQTPRQHNTPITIPQATTAHSAAMRGPTGPSTLATGPAMAKSGSANPVVDSWAQTSSQRTQAPPSDASPPTKGRGPFLAVALYDFQADQAIELDGVKANTRLSVHAYSNEEWLVASRFDPAEETRRKLIPLTYVALLDPKSGHALPWTKNELLSILPSVDQWRKRLSPSAGSSTRFDTTDPKPNVVQSTPQQMIYQSTTPKIPPPRNELPFGMKPHQPPLAMNDLPQPRAPDMSPGNHRKAKTGSITSIGSHHKAMSSLSSFAPGHRHRVSASQQRNGSIPAISSPMSNPTLRDGPGAVTRLATSLPQQSSTQSSLPPSKGGSSQPFVFAAVGTAPGADAQQTLPSIPLAPTPFGPAARTNGDLAEKVNAPPDSELLPVTGFPNSEPTPDPFVPNTDAIPSSWELDCQPLAPGVPHCAQVDAVHKEADAYWYRVRCLWAPEPKGKTRQLTPPVSTSAQHQQQQESVRPKVELELYRLYEDFAEFDLALKTNFPLEDGRGPPGSGSPILPTLPLSEPSDYDARRRKEWTIVEADERRAALDRYTQSLVSLPSSVTRSNVVKMFFDPRPGDRSVVCGGLTGSNGTDPYTTSSAAVPAHVPTGGSDPSGLMALPSNRTDLTVGMDRMQVSNVSQTTTCTATSRTAESGWTGSSEGEASFNHPSSGTVLSFPTTSGTRHYNPSSTAATTPTTPSSAGSRTNKTSTWTKIKMFHSATDELVAVRVDASSITYAELLAKTRGRLGQHIEVLRYPETLGAMGSAAAAAEAAERGVVPPDVNAQAATTTRTVMARLLDDDDVHDWLQHGSGNPMLFAAAQ